MAIKVNDISAVNQVPEATKTVEGDGSFKFTLASAITDADLQAKWMNCSVILRRRETVLQSTWTSGI